MLNVIVNELIEGAEKAEGTAVIVDIFRATSNLSTLFELGVKEIYPALDIQEARKLKSKLEKDVSKKIYLGGESEGITPSDFDLSNSPYDTYHNFKDKLNNRPVIYTSTNGVKGIQSAKKSNEIITASFLNYRAVADYLNKTNPELVTIVGMGEFGKSSPEDRLFSYFLKDILTGQPTDLEEIKKSIYEGESAKWLIKNYGEKIKKDIDFCLNTDLNFNVVPKLYGDKLIDVLKK